MNKIVLRNSALARMPGDSEYLSTTEHIKRASSMSMSTGILYLSQRLTYHCRTRPHVYGARCAALVGVAFEADEFSKSREKILDLVIASVNRANWNLEPD